MGRPNKLIVNGEKRLWWLLTCRRCRASVRWFGTEAEEWPRHRCAKTRRTEQFTHSEKTTGYVLGPDV